MVKPHLVRRTEKRATILLPTLTTLMLDVVLDNEKPLTSAMTNSPVSQTVAINRALIGIIAVALLAGAGVLWFVAGSQNMWTGASLKVGLVMAALWLALPTVSRHGNWGRASLGTVIGFMALALVLTGKRVDIRIVLPMLLGVAVTVMVLRPRSKTRSK